MTAGTVILWRHGQTDYNVGGRLQGQVDIPLNAVGIAQAEMAAQVLAKVRPTAIITSDLVRAHATAEALGEVSGTPVSVDPRLRERSFGVWEGLTREQVRQEWPTEFDAWQSGAPPQGVGVEGRGDVGHRVAAAITDGVADLGEDDVLVATTHGAAIATGVAALLGLDPDQSRVISGVGNCHWSVLRHNTQDVQTWRLAAHNIGAESADFAQAARIV